MLVNEQIPLFDHGYTRLIEVYGDELTIINAARASFQKEHAVWLDSDSRLLDFLLREKHMTPFRHVFGHFEIRAPLEVARQLWKYVVGSDHTMETAWSESSRRYVTEQPQFYIPVPEAWRSIPDNKKQGSGDPVSVDIGEEATKRLIKTVVQALENYEWALNRGIAPEMARLFFPAYGLFVTWRWTASLQALLHLFDERLADNAQVETRTYVTALYQLIKPHFPHVFSRYHREEES